MRRTPFRSARGVVGPTAILALTFACATLPLTARAQAAPAPALASSAPADLPVTGAATGPDSTPITATAMAAEPADVPPGAPYTLRMAVDDALARNPTVGMAGADLTTAGLVRETAEWGRYPTVSVEVAPGFYSSGSSAGSSRSLRIDQPLWSGGRITGQIDSAKAQEKSADLGVSEARRSVAEQTSVAYLGWVGATERLRIAVEGRSVFEKLLNYVQRRQRAGAAATSDVSVARARLDASLVQRDQLQGELDHAASDLKALVVGDLGRPVATLVPPFPVSAPDAVEALYVDHSNVLGQRQADIDAARAAVKVSQGEASPQLLLRLQRSGSSLNGITVPSSTQLGFAVEFTPQPGLAALSSIRAAESRILSAQEKMRSDDLDLRSHARSHLTDFRSASLQLADLLPQIDELRATAESYMRQFEAGKRSWIDVLNAYREMLDAKVSVSRAQSQRDQNAAHLMANTGTLLPWIDSP